MGSTKVNDFNGAFRLAVDKNILWLEITMRDILLVTVRDGLQELFEDDSSLKLGEPASRDDLIEELTALTKFCHKENS